MLRSRLTCKCFRVSSSALFTPALLCVESQCQWTLTLTASHISSADEDSSMTHLNGGKEKASWQHHRRLYIVGTTMTTL